MKGSVWQVLIYTLGGMNFPPNFVYIVTFSKEMVQWVLLANHRKDLRIILILKGILFYIWGLPWLLTGRGRFERSIYNLLGIQVLKFDAIYIGIEQLEMWYDKCCRRIKISEQEIKYSDDLTVYYVLTHLRYLQYEKKREGNSRD